MAGEPHQVGLTEHLGALAHAIRSGQPVPAGRLFGLPELPDDDCWLDIAGAAALTGVAQDHYQLAQPGRSGKEPVSGSSQTAVPTVLAPAGHH